jgi:hypothetical protein
MLTAAFFNRKLIKPIITVRKPTMLSFSNMSTTNLENSQTKKLIAISPAGYKGFFVMGICKYIKQNYNLENYVFSGASAGAWNSLLLCFNRDIQEIEDKVIDASLQNMKSIHDLENLIKHRILTEFTSADFDLSRLFIGVTVVHRNSLRNFANITIFTNFENLEDALNCCMASSHIPLITGNLTTKYRNLYSFDGGFSKYPYLANIKPSLLITPSIWKNNISGNVTEEKIQLIEYTTLFSKEKFNFMDMIQYGYEHAKYNKHHLDSIFGAAQK